MTLAQSLFDSYMAYMKVDWDLGEVIQRLFGENWADYAFDDYDESLEVYGVPNDFRLGREAVDEFIDKCGFAIVFVNHADGFETHYTRSKRDGWRTPEPRGRNHREFEIGQIKKYTQRAYAAKLAASPGTAHQSKEPDKSQLGKERG